MCAYMHTDTNMSIYLSICLSVCLSVCLYKTFIGTGILEVFKGPESVADRWNGMQVFSLDVKKGLYSIDTGILEVCEYTDSVTDW